MSTDSSKPTHANDPIDVAVEGLVLRPEAFKTPGAGVNDGKPNVGSAYAAVAREKADIPVTSSQIFPLWALIPIIGVVLAAGSYLGSNLALGPNLNGYDYALKYPEEIQSIEPELDPYDPKVWVARGKAEYATVCAACHQGSGEGLPGVNPPLKNSEYVIHGEERVVSILLHGISGPLQVNGKSYNGMMPAQGATKNDKAIAQIASYIRNEWGNQGSLIYDDQVSALRKKLANRTGPFSEGQLKDIPQDANLPPSKHGGAAPSDPAAAAAAGPAATPATATPAAASPAPAPAPQ